MSHSHECTICQMKILSGNTRAPIQAGKKAKIFNPENNKSPKMGRAHTHTHGGHAVSLTI